MYIEILGFCVGILYLWWEYHADPKMWIASIVMPTISMWVYFSKGLYADFAINIYYFLIAIYGWIVWTRKAKASLHPESISNPDSSGDAGGNGLSKVKDAQTEKNKLRSTLPITHIPRLILAGASAAFLAIWGALYLILAYLTDSTVPVADSFTTALSIVASWMLARKYVEQWLAWIVVDAVCVGLYIYKEIYFYAALYAIYTVIAFFGYRKWLRAMREQA